MDFQFLLIFDLDGERFGLDATQVRETVWLPELTPVEAARRPAICPEATPDERALFRARAAALHEPCRYSYRDRGIAAMGKNPDTCPTDTPLPAAN